jgi:hypothetical protein
MTESDLSLSMLALLNKEGILHIKKAMAVSKRLTKIFVKAYISVS